MKPIFLDDPAWQATFPHRIVPLQDEWLPGLLLRCDEVNHWEGGATMAHIPRTLSTSSAHALNITEPSLVFLEHVSLVLALPFHAVAATTYQAEVDRLSDGTRHLLIQPLARFRLSFCPQCVAVRRLLLRTLMLPHITMCPHQRLTLQTACRCGASLQLFAQQTPPFTCPTCGLDWKQLPHRKASPALIAIEQWLLSYYVLFFSLGNSRVVHKRVTSHSRA